MELSRVCRLPPLLMVDVVGVTPLSVEQPAERSGGTVDAVVGFRVATSDTLVFVKVLAGWVALVAVTAMTSVVRVHSAALGLAAVVGTSVVSRTVVSTAEPGPWGRARQAFSFAVEAWVAGSVRYVEEGVQHFFLLFSVGAMPATKMAVVASYMERSGPRSVDGARTSATTVGSRPAVAAAVDVDKRWWDMRRGSMRHVVEGMHHFFFLFSVPVIMLANRVTVVAGSFERPVGGAPRTVVTVGRRFSPVAMLVLAMTVAVTVTVTVGVRRSVVEEAHLVFMLAVVEVVVVAVRQRGLQPRGAVRPTHTPTAVTMSSAAAAMLLVRTMLMLVRTATPSTPAPTPG